MTFRKDKFQVLELTKRLVTIWESTKNLGNVSNSLLASILFQIVNTLRELTELSPFYDLIQNTEGLPLMADTYMRIIEFDEKREQEEFVKEVGIRRMRLGSDPLTKIQQNVNLDISKNSAV